MSLICFDEAGDACIHAVFWRLEHVRKQPRYDLSGGTARLAFELALALELNIYIHIAVSH